MHIFYTLEVCTIAANDVYNFHDENYWFDPLTTCNNHPPVVFDDSKIKMARKPGKKLKEHLVGCTTEGKI